MRYICMCQDSTGTPHNIPITKKEYKQDGICTTCADHVWNEMNSNTTYNWKHTTQRSKK